jgi:hypothetical protein
MEEKQWDRLRSNLGPWVAYGFYQPEQSYYKLDFEALDDRLMASLMVQLANAEDNMQISPIREPRLVYPNGEEFPFQLGVPRSWEKYSELPSNGTFTFRYMCAPEDRRFEKRKDFGATYGDWRCNVGTDSVSWWMSLWGVPNGVMRLLHCSLRAFPDMDAVFRYIDAPLHNHSLSFLKLKERTRKLGWKELEDDALLREVFRYLDPNGNAHISKAEWEMMKQLWEELKFRIFEFLVYIDRVYSGRFDDAFVDIDSDRSGGINLIEWQAACKAIGFYGPTLAIFSYAADVGEVETRQITQKGWAKLQALYATNSNKVHRGSIQALDAKLFESDSDNRP